MEQLFRDKLEKVSNESRDSIRKQVAIDALEYENVENFFGDLLTYGCASGMITGLIYYSDTHKFYDTYYNEIEEIRCEYEDQCGSPLSINGDLKNWLAWFSYETTAYNLAYEIGLEV